MYFVFKSCLIRFLCLFPLFHLTEMPHHCIVPLCTNNSTMPDLSFYRLPLHDQNLLERWIVNIRRENIHINKHSRIAVLTLKEEKSKERMLYQPYLHGLKKLSPEHHLNKEILLFQLENPVPLGSQHLFLQKTMLPLVPGSLS